MSSSIVCEEIFDEISQPSVEEIRDYATKIGIDPDSEPQLLPLAAEGLMKALPPGWKPCYDDRSKSYYYYNNITKKTQWEHPLDEVYRGLVKKAKTDSQSFSLNNDQTDDNTCMKDDIYSMEESLPQKSIDTPISLGARKKDLKLSPLKLGGNRSPKHELFKQKSEDIMTCTIRTFNKFSSFDEDVKDSTFDKHPRALELKVAGGGSMFLKSNTKRSTDVSPGSFSKNDNLDLQPRSILREKHIMEPSKSMEFDKVSTADKSDKDDEDKKSVRFNLDNNTTDVGITFSDKSSSEEENEMNSDKNRTDDIINVKLTKSRFSVTPVTDSSNPPLKLIIPNPSDFIKPKLTLKKGSDSDEDTKSLDKVELQNIDEFFDSDESDTSVQKRLKEKFQDKAERKLSEIKQTIWEEKNVELIDFKEKVQQSHKSETERLLEEERIVHKEKLKTELDNLRTEMEQWTTETIKEERVKLEQKLQESKQDLDMELKNEETKLKEHFENKKDELEKYYEEKLAEIEKELADRVEKNKEELILIHNANVEQLRQNHSIIIEQMKREFQVEEQILRQQHQAQMSELKSKMQNDIESQDKIKPSHDERQFEKLRCEKRLLEDKYRCLKDKYLRLKTDVKISIEKKNRKKEHNSANTTATTTTTGSETEQSHSHNKDRTSFDSPTHKYLDKPPTPKHVAHNKPTVVEPQKVNKAIKQVMIQDMDTSVSDNCYQSDDKANQNDSSDSINPGRSRKKLFSRLKSSSTSRINVNSKTRKNQRSCSPVENLRRQLQKLEDLEDQFPQNSQSETYHLRYPFSDGQKFEGSSELEFFRHRIHLERDSIKRAKESLRNQKTIFQQRQKELKLKHGSMARHTLQQLCQEEKELTDMEVNLHRTRSLLGEKVIRLRHLEQSLQRANMHNEQPKQDDATLSDISSHSASSGISSTEFAAADQNYGKAVVKSEHLQESSEIIQSLENLNSEIREIWDVLRNQQQQSSIPQVIPPLLYPDLGWPILAGSSNIPAPPSIPTLADRLHNYRQHVALANAQSTVVTHANQGATTTLVERTRNLRHWLRQTGIDVGNEGSPPQTTL